MPQSLQILLNQILSVQSVLVSASTQTNQQALVEGLFKAMEKFTPDSLISLELIAPEKSSLGIEIVRDLQKQLSYAATAQRPRWIALLQAETLTTTAQNALLKTLEEPPPHTFLILCTAYPDQLLETIRSRTLEVKDRILMEATGDRSSSSSSTTNNSTHDSGPEYEDACMGSLAQACERAEEFKDKEQATQYIHTLLAGAYSELEQAAKNEKTEAVEKHSRNLRLLLTTDSQLQANCNIKLTVAELFMQLQ